MDTLASREQTHVQKILKTVFLVIVWACIGLCLEITGPTLIDLKIRTNSNYESVASAVSGRSAGYFIGSALGGLLVDTLGHYSDLIVAVCLDGMAAFTVALPWSPVTELIFFTSLCGGTFEGIINIAGQKLIIDMWQEKSASPLHILHGGFGIGSFIIPLIANPFLAVPFPEDDMNQSLSDTNQLSITMAMPTTTTETRYLKPSRIEIAYAIAAAIVVVVSLVFYFYHFLAWRSGHFVKSNGVTGNDVTKETLSTSVERNSLASKMKTMFNPATCSGGRFAYGLSVMGLVVVYFFQAVGAERVGGKFIRAFSIDYHKFSNDDGSYINTAFWIAFSAGRVGAFLAARWIPIRILILIETGGCLISASALAIFGTSGPTALWIIMPILGAFIAPLFPSGIGWANFHLEVTGIAITIFLLGGSLGGIVYMKLVGYLYDTYGPKMFLYTLLGCGILACVMSVFMNIVGNIHGSRFNWDTDKAETEINVEEKEKPKDSPL